MPDPENLNTPIVVPASPLVDQISAAARSVGLVVGAIGTLAGLAKAHDLAGFVSYVQTSDFALAASIAVTAGTFAWGQIKTRKRAKQAAAMAKILPDSIAQTK